jgi:hypothetical protein
MALPPVSAEAAATAKYFHSGPFNHTQVRSDFATRFKKDAHFNADSTDDLETLLGFIETDSRVTDIRWMAYMLATAYWETSHIVHKQVTKTDPKTHKETTRDIKVWRNMEPVEEVGHGAGRNYFLPAKVKRLPDGTARLTEHDGDQWTVGINGVAKKVNKGAQVGAKATGKEAKLFTDDDGAELEYYGRGYVQLTWWQNYASTGAAIGEGLNLLFDPERALVPSVAYAVMARGMITGEGFANGRKLSTFFHGAHTDYPGARAMVNGIDHKDDIAKIAELFEAILLQNKVTGTSAATAGAAAGVTP